MASKCLGAGGMHGAPNYVSFFTKMCRAMRPSELGALNLQFCKYVRQSLRLAELIGVIWHRSQPCKEVSSTFVHELLAGWPPRMAAPAALPFFKLRQLAHP